MATGVLYHTKEGSYTEPQLKNEDGSPYVRTYEAGQLYGIYEETELAAPEILALRNLAFKELPEKFNSRLHQWNPQLLDVEPKALSADESLRQTLVNKGTALNQTEAAAAVALLQKVKF